jgi:hypothetical protein
MGSTPSQVVENLLQNSLNPTIFNELVAPDVTYASLTLNNPELQKILSYAGVEKNGGPEAVLKVFGTVNKIRVSEAFRIHTHFDGGENVAVFD